MGELREQMRAEMVGRRYSPSTVKSYLEQIKRFAKYFMRCPSEMGMDEIREYQRHLAEETNTSAGYQCMFGYAVKFLYKVILILARAFTAHSAPQKNAIRQPVML